MKGGSGVGRSYLGKIKNNTRLTVFQKHVLRAALSIPRGEVRSYAWVAEKALTKAYRAVGAALGKNPYAPHVPCHRVIASDGSIGGYSGGITKKRELLRREGIVFVRKNNRWMLGTRNFKISN